MEPTVASPVNKHRRISVAAITAVNSAAFSNSALTSISSAANDEDSAPGGFQLKGQRRLSAIAISTTPREANSSSSFSLPTTDFSSKSPPLLLPQQQQQHQHQSHHAPTTTTTPAPEIDYSIPQLWELIEHHSTSKVKLLLPDLTHKHPHYLPKPRRTILTTQFTADGEIDESAGDHMQREQRRLEFLCTRDCRQLLGSRAANTTLTSTTTTAAAVAGPKQRMQQVMKHISCTLHTDLSGRDKERCEGLLNLYRYDETRRESLLKRVQQREQQATAERNRLRDEKQQRQLQELQRLQQAGLGSSMRHYYAKRPSHKHRSSSTSSSGVAGLSLQQQRQRRRSSAVDSSSTDSSDSDSDTDDSRAASVEIATAVAAAVDATNAVRKITAAVDTMAAVEGEEEDDDETAAEAAEASDSLSLLPATASLALTPVPPTTDNSNSSNNSNSSSSSSNSINSSGISPRRRSSIYLSAHEMNERRQSMAAVRRCTISQQQQQLAAELAATLEEQQQQVQLKLKASSTPLHQLRVLDWLRVVAALHKLSRMGNIVITARMMRKESVHWRAAVFIQRCYRKHLKYMRFLRYGHTDNNNSSSSNSSNNSSTTTAVVSGKFTMNSVAALLRKDPNRRRNRRVYLARRDSCAVILQFLRENAGRLQYVVARFLRRVRKLQLLLRPHLLVTFGRYDLLSRFVKCVLPTLLAHMEVVSSGKGLDLQNVTAAEMKRVTATAPVKNNVAYGNNSNNSNSSSSSGSFQHAIFARMNTTAFHSFLRNQSSKLEAVLAVFHDKHPAHKALRFRSDISSCKQQLLRDLAIRKRRHFVASLDSLKVLQIQVPLLLQEDVRSFVKGMGADPLSSYLAEKFQQEQEMVHAHLMRQHARRTASITNSTRLSIAASAATAVAIATAATAAVTTTAVTAGGVVSSNNNATQTHSMVTSGNVPSFLNVINNSSNHITNNSCNNNSNNNNSNNSINNSINNNISDSSNNNNSSNNSSNNSNNNSSNTTTTIKARRPFLKQHSFDRAASLASAAQQYKHSPQELFFCLLTAVTPEDIALWCIDVVAQVLDVKAERQRVKRRSQIQSFELSLASSQDGEDDVLSLLLSDSIESEAQSSNLSKQQQQHQQLTSTSSTTTAAAMVAGSTKETALRPADTATALSTSSAAVVATIDSAGKQQPKIVASRLRNVLRRNVK